MQCNVYIENYTPLPISTFNLYLCIFHFQQLRMPMAKNDPKFWSMSNRWISLSHYCAGGTQFLVEKTDFPFP